MGNVENICSKSDEQVDSWSLDESTDQAKDQGTSEA